MKIEMPKDWFEKRLTVDEGEVGVGVPSKTVAEMNGIDIDKAFPKYNKGREIKFRVWYPNDRNGFYYTKIEDAAFILGIDAWHESFVIQLSTGLKSGGDVEIYEGDIVNYRDKLAEIKYETDRGGFIIEWKWDKNQHSHDLTCDSAMECRVIGNIFKHPELIK